MAPPILDGSIFYPVAHLPLTVIRTPNSSHRRHSHNFQEIVLVASGAANHLRYAPDSDEPDVYPLTEGDIFWVPLGWSHAYEKDAACEIYNILFANSLLGGWDVQPSQTFLGALEDESRITQCELLQKLHLNRGEMESLEGLLRLIMRELSLQSCGFEIAARAKLAEVLVFLERVSQSRRGHSPALLADNSVMTQAVAFIEQHFAEPITLRDIARAVHLSPNYFCEQFTTTVGQPPGRYLNRLRLEHARYLALTTFLPITEIAHKSGFADSSYFARSFKAAFGVTPSRLRESGRGMIGL